MLFETEYNKIIKKLEFIDPVAYGKTRNYVHGAVTYLSPYISRGVISTRMVLEHILKHGYTINQTESFVQELCWRDYFQRVGQTINLYQEEMHEGGIPAAVVDGNTGIRGIDEAIIKLYQTGYMHNHCRMYVASLVCNITHSHWLHPSQWMYYHLLDGDWASNGCSWQWVAGVRSKKKYYANQENINKYTGTNQQNTFLDKSYEELPQIVIPDHLKANRKDVLTTELPFGNKKLEINDQLPTYIYNYYNLDPTWHKNEIGNRILLLEPEHFNQYPISKKCIHFMLDLSLNIANIQMYIGSFNSLCKEYNIKNTYYKEHPLNIGYAGTEESRDWIVPQVTGYYPSFFAYWKKIKKQLL